MKKLLKIPRLITIFVNSELWKKTWELNKSVSAQKWKLFRVS